MSTTWRRILKFLAVVVIGLVLVGVGFVLGHSSLGSAGLVPAARSRLGAVGFGLGGGLSIILNILFWALVIGLGVWLVSSLASGRATSQLSSGPTSPLEAPLDILKKRYARGEITKTEFDDMRRDLSA